MNEEQLYNELLISLKTALYIIDDFTQNTPTEDNPYLEEIANIRHVLDKISENK